MGGGTLCRPPVLLCARPHLAKVPVPPRGSLSTQVSGGGQDKPWTPASLHSLTRGLQPWAAGSGAGPRKPASLLPVCSAPRTMSCPEPRATVPRPARHGDQQSRLRASPEMATASLCRCSGSQKLRLSSTCDSRGEHQVAPGHACLQEMASRGAARTPQLCPGDSPTSSHGTFPMRQGCTEKIPVSERASALARATQPVDARVPGALATTTSVYLRWSCPREAHPGPRGGAVMVPSQPPSHQTEALGRRPWPTPCDRH